VPLPSWLARVNRRVTNRLLDPAAATLPYFGVIYHRGRVSGRVYRTPVNVFPTDDGVIIALTYGRTDWVRNVMATGGCEIVHRGRGIELVSPRLLGRIEAGAAVPSFVRFALDLLGVEEFLVLRRQKG
jgi:deazaflavin-dependent oxidoreductase (nitroreductase family)